MTDNTRNGSQDEGGLRERLLSSGPGRWVIAGTLGAGTMALAAGLAFAGGGGGSDMPDPISLQDRIDVSETAQLDPTIIDTAPAPVLEVGADDSSFDNTVDDTFATTADNSLATVGDSPNDSLATVDVSPDNSVQTPNDTQDASFDSPDNS